MTSAAGVVVLHPRGHPAYEAALAAQEAGLLRRYDTTIYRTGLRPLGPAAALLPGPFRASLERDMGRRWHPDLDPELVTTRPLAQVLYQLARRALPLPPELQVELEYAAMRAYGRAAARSLARGPRPRLVHVYEGCALEVIRAARTVGCACLLDVQSRHEDYLQIEQEESRRWGLPAHHPPAGISRRVERERAEADILLAPSQATRALLLRAGVPDERIVVLPYGADADTFRPPLGRPEGRFRAVYVGHVTFRKGVAYLLEAWSRLGLAGAELLVVGNPDPAGRALLERYPGVCRALRNVPHRELPALLDSCDVFVCPSLAEGSPLVVYEAMAAGLPVITTESAQAVVRDGIDGLVVPIRDVDALARAIAFLHANRGERLRMGREARLRIQNGFTWRHYRVRLAGIYRHLLEGRREPIPPPCETP
jgi:glycosyltransferase involved in cell wall biosynthesis